MDGIRVGLKGFLFVLALVLFFLAAVLWAAPAEPHRLRLVSAGLFCWALSEVV